MFDLLWQGLMISVMGMGTTFAALGLLILTMVLLDYFFGAQPPVHDEATPAKKPLVSPPAPDTEDEEIAAAIAVALTYLRTADTYHGHLGATLEAGRGPWWAMGQTRQRSAKD